MMLRIRNVGPSDFGSYKCVAKNSLGETDGVIKLDGTLFTCKHKIKYKTVIMLMLFQKYQHQRRFEQLHHLQHLDQEKKVRNVHE